MKKYRTTIIVLAVLAVVAAVFVTVLLTRNDKGGGMDGETGSDSEYVSLFDFAKNDIIGLESSYNEKYTLVKYDDDGSEAWKCTSDESIDIYASSVSTLTSGIAVLKGYIIKDVGSLDEYGFNDGKSDIYVTIHLSNGNSVTAYVGDHDFKGSNFYITVAGRGNTVYKVSKSYAADLMIQKEDLVNMKIFTFDTSDSAEYFLVRQKGEKTLELTAGGKEGDDSVVWKVNYPIERDGESSSINEFISAMRNISLSGIYEEHCGDLSVFGLDVPAIEYYLRTVSADGKTTLHTVRIGDKTPDGGYYYCTIDDTGDVYTVSTSSVYKNISPMSFISTFIYLVDSSYVSRVDIEIGEEKHEMRIEYETVTKKNDKTGEDEEEIIETRFFDGKEAPDNDDYSIVVSDGSFLPPTAEQLAANRDDNFDNDVLTDNPYDCFNHLLASLYADIKLAEVVLDEPEEKGELIAAVTYTQTDGKVVKIELFKRDNTTAYIYANGSYAGGYCRTTAIFGDSYQNYDVFASIKALKAVLKTVP